MMIHTVFTPLLKRLSQWLAIAILVSGSGLALSQAEPTLTEIYATAQAGKVDQAQVMIQQVLISHPNSAKAHFVAAELFARQGKASLAGESLATAEKLAPGLPFAKSEAVQQLRSQIAASRNANLNSPSQASASHPIAAASTTPSWALPLLLAIGVIGIGFFVFRKKTPLAGTPGIGSGLGNNGLNGPQTFGNGINSTPAMAGGYGQPGYAQPTGNGIGGRVMGGLATGLAVGAGVMAAQAIGKTLMGDHDNGTKAADTLDHNFEPLPGNPDMGGQNFGISDAGSWDDAGGVSDGGSWDN